MTRARLSHALKAIAASVLYYSGLLLVWRSVVLRRRAVVLMYHRVLSDHDRRETGSHPGIVVDRDTFAMHMAALKRHFVVISAEELAARLEQKRPLPSSACVITFDDGWRDNYTNALPILLEHELPAVVYLPVNYIGSERLFWREALAQLLFRAVEHVGQHPASRARFEELLAPLGLGAILTAGCASRAEIAERLGPAERLTWESARALVGALARELGVDPDRMGSPDGFITWQEAQSMSSRGITFGGHGAEHRLLTAISSDDARAEIGAARIAIRKALDAEASTFSYPNGSWSPAVANQVRAAGYRLAFTTRPGFVTSEDDPFALPRMNVHQDVTDTTPLFLARVVGIF